MSAHQYQGSWQAFEVQVKRDVRVPARDGIGLATDLYFPALHNGLAPGPFPVLVERTPYDKAATRFVLHARFFARHGYVVLVQDVRGRGNSAGEWYPFAHEAPDGYDTIEWAAAQPWSNGKVGTMGTSYMAAVQSAAATLNPPHLKAMFVTEYGSGEDVAQPQRKADWFADVMTTLESWPEMKGVLYFDAAPPGGCTWWADSSPEWPGYMDGAIRSGARTAKAVLRTL